MMAAQKVGLVVIDYLQHRTGCRRCPASASGDCCRRGARGPVKADAAVLIVAKQRKGPTVTVGLRFCPELAPIENHVPAPV